MFYELLWVLLLFEQQGIAAHQTGPHTICARFNVVGLGGGGGKKNPDRPTHDASNFRTF